MEKPGIHHYINYEWKADGSFEARVPKPILLREKIDAYEIRNAPDLQYKSYINFKNGVAGIYYSGKLNQLFITSFQ